MKRYILLFSVFVLLLFGVHISINSDSGYQPDPIDQYQTIEAAVEDLFTQTAEATPRNQPMTATVGAAFEMAMTQTAVSPVDGAIDYNALTQARSEDGAFVIGDPDAPVTIVVFSDFLCPHCQRYQETVEQIMRELVMTGQARLEYRMLPTTTLSPYVGQVAECAGEQYAGGFFPVHDALYRIASNSRVTDDIGERIADEFDLDYGDLLTCALQADQVTIDHYYSADNGIQGTPALRLRYGDSALEAIVGYERGGPPFDVIAEAVMLH